jgi:hypothetical protein
MTRLTDNDRNWGPFTFARWERRLSAHFSTGDDEDPENHLLFVGFGWALRVRLGRWLKPGGKYGEHEREWGFSLTDQRDTVGSSKGFDSIHISFGLQSMDSSTERGWYKTFPWTEWDHVRREIYRPNGQSFAVEKDWKEFYEIEKTCPKSYFAFEDYDGTRIVAACTIEEREWHRGRGWFKWLRHFSKPIIHRSLRINLSEEMGPEKGSWKGGTIRTSCNMETNDTPEDAFKRWCDREHRSKYRNFKAKYVGPSEPVATIL